MMCLMLQVKFTELREASIRNAPNQPLSKLFVKAQNTTMYQVPGTVMIIYNN